MDSRHRDNSIVSNLISKGSRIYYKAPNGIRWILWPVRLIYRFFNILRLNLWIITGNEISSGKQLAMVYAGHELDKNYIINLAFGSFEENYIGKKWLWQISQIVKKDDHDCSLMIIEVPNTFRLFSEKMKWLYIPSWIFGEIDISVDNPSLFKHRNTSLKSDLIKIKRNRLHFEVTEKLSQLQNFYYNMHVPYITKAHSNRAVIASYASVMREFFKRGMHNTLLFIKKENEYIAGVLLHYKKDRAKLSTLGVKNGNSDYVRDGAIGALFYFSIQYLAEKGITKFDFGESRSFLKDGVLQYKKKWNPTIYSRKKTGYLVKILSKTDGVKGFFLNNPFIYQDKSGLNGAIFLEGDQSISKVDFEKIYKKYYIQGLSNLMVYQFGETNINMKDIVPTEYSDKISVCSASDVF